jgi:RHS repeat-associated protein
LFPIDSNGNLSTKTEGTDLWGYEWNANNELTRVTKNSVEQARFSYDPLGRRVEKVAGGVTTSYTYDEDDLLREQTSTGTTAKYIHSGLIDEPLAREDSSGALSYFHLDALSSPIKTTDAAGAVIATYVYDAFGNLQQGTPVTFGFTSREPDGVTGLVYYRARYFDPKIGRFLTEDPAGLVGSRNLYAYVDNSPTNFTDPLGLVKTSGCTAAQAQAIDEAVNEAEQKLEKCRCGGAGGAGSGSSGGGGSGNPEKLIKIINSAKYICKQNMKDLCGKAPLRPFGNRIYIGSPGFQPNVCGPLSCTIIHEATHRTQWFFSRKKQEQAEEMEKRCCGL